MSPKNSVLKAGLSALGLFGIAVAAAADPPAFEPVERAPSAAPASASSDSVLLMSDGKVLRGTVAQTPTGYTLTHRGNALPLRRAQVQGVFPSLAEAYRFQADHVPARDPDEQMKLARWCLTNDLVAEAKTHLKVVVALSPASPAKRMLEGIELAEARSAPRDANVQQATVEMPQERAARAPRSAGPIGPPQIFDLPPALAMRKANEFALRVQPVLQRVCAGCHNETYTGEFQLVQFRSRHDRTADAYRMNLDAVLRLVDPDNPGKSELLSSCLRPHGAGPRKRPIFLGSNNPDYQVLAVWVNSLRAPHGPTAAAPVAPSPAPGDGEVFAADRATIRAAATPGTAVPAMKAAGPDFTPVQVPPKRYVPGQGMVTETAPPAPGEFPVPFTVSGQAPPKPATAPAVPADRPKSPASIPPPVPPPAAGAVAKDAAKKPPKPVKIDEALLQQVLQNRNTTR